MGSQHAQRSEWDNHRRQRQQRGSSGRQAHLLTLGDRIPRSLRKRGYGFDLQECAVSQAHLN